MSLAWTCCTYPLEHGSFFQRGIDLIQEQMPEMRRSLPPHSPTHKKSQRMYRRACPKCCVEHKAGHVRPASHDETLALIAQSRRADPQPEVARMATQ